MALPDTAAASGTVQSTSNWPGSSTSRRLVRFSDWLRNGTVRKTTGPFCAASAFSRPSTSASGTASFIFAAASAARSALREPITTAWPARAHRSARPKPRAPVPPMMGIGSSLTAAQSTSAHAARS